LSAKKGMLITLITAAAIVLSCFVIIPMLNMDIFRQFGPLTVKVENKSDYDIESITFGLAREETPETSHAPGIKSGKSRSIKPRLSPLGENGIYMDWTDERGETRSASVCSYTESASGYTVVIIDNTNVQVEENCT
jgi:hypothetical protein